MAVQSKQRSGSRGAYFTADFAGAAFAFFAFFLAIEFLRANDLPPRALIHLIRKLACKVYDDCGFLRG